jgi:hypothetical protein
MGSIAGKRSQLHGRNQTSSLDWSMRYVQELILTMGSLTLSSTSRRRMRRYEDSMSESGSRSLLLPFLLLEHIGFRNLSSYARLAPSMPEIPPAKDIWLSRHGLMTGWIVFVQTTETRHHGHLNKRGHRGFTISYHPLCS